MADNSVVRYDRAVSLVVTDENGIPYNQLTESEITDVFIPHRGVYELCLVNHHHRYSVTAEIIIDGRAAGTWLLGSNERLCVKRPIARDGRFTLVRKQSVEEYADGLSVVGDLTVIVRRAKESADYDAVTDGVVLKRVLFGFSLKKDQGITLLGQASNQRFRPVPNRETVFLTMIRRRLVAV